MGLILSFIASCIKSLGIIRTTFSFLFIPRTCVDRSEPYVDPEIIIPLEFGVHLFIKCLMKEFHIKELCETKLYFSISVLILGIITLIFVDLELNSKSSCIDKGSLNLNTL